MGTTEAEDMKSLVYHGVILLGIVTIFMNAYNVYISENPHEKEGWGMVLVYSVLVLIMVIWGNWVDSWISGMMP